MTTAADLVHETRNLLLSGRREQLNTLNGPIDDNETTLTFAHDLREIQQDTVLSVDSELMYVWEASPAARTAVVERGISGSTAAAHLSGAFCYPNTPFSGFACFNALNADLADLSAEGLFGVDTVTLDWNPAVYGYDMTGAVGVIDLLRVRYDVPGPEEDWPETFTARLIQDGDLTDFPSGFGVVVKEAYPGLQVRVTYSKQLTPFTALDDDVADTGLPTTAYDLPPLGAAMKLAGVREVGRNLYETQGSTRRGAEVGVNAQVAGMNALRILRQARLKSETSRLVSDYPPRRVIF